MNVRPYSGGKLLIKPSSEAVRRIRERLVMGLITAPAGRTVCGMLTAAGMATVWHHSKVHRFFTTTRWSPDQLGLTMLRLIVGWLLPVDAPIVIAVHHPHRARRARRKGRQAH